MRSLLQQIAAMVLLLCSLVAASSAFSVIIPSSAIGSKMQQKAPRSAFGIITTSLKAVMNKDDFPPQKDDEYDGDVDWDEEWKKVVKGEGQPVERPSGDPTSEVERVALAAQRQAEETMFKVKSSARRNLNFNSLKGDWKVIINLLI
jgi:hypothetical protein